LEERNLMRKRIARILVEGISTVEFFFLRESPKRMSGGAEGISASDFLERERKRAAKRMGEGVVGRDETPWPSIIVI
jgi:hypothetical protein